MPKKFCCVNGCFRKRDEHPGRIFYGLPVSPQRRLAWLGIIGRHDLMAYNEFLLPTSHLVCDLHFAENAPKTPESVMQDLVPIEFPLDNNAQAAPLNRSHELSPYPFRPTFRSDQSSIERTVDPHAPRPSRFSLPNDLSTDERTTYPHAPRQSRISLPNDLSTVQRNINLHVPGPFRSSLPNDLSTVERSNDIYAAGPSRSTNSLLPSDQPSSESYTVPMALGPSRSILPSYQSTFKRNTVSYAPGPSRSIHSLLPGNQSSSEINIVSYPIVSSRCTLPDCQSTYERNTVTYAPRSPISHTPPDDQSNFEKNVVPYAPRPSGSILSLLPGDQLNSESNIVPIAHEPSKSTVTLSGDQSSSESNIVSEPSSVTLPDDQSSSELDKTNQIMSHSKPTLTKIGRQKDFVTPNVTPESVSNLCRYIAGKFKSKRKSNRKFQFYALNMYLLNPYAYNFTNATMNLPDEKTIRRIKLKVSPKLDNRVLDCLSSKLKSYPERAKYCTVCIGAMQVKHHLFYDILNDEVVGLQNINGEKTVECAGYVYVTMLRGILINWNQPLAYCFLASNQNYAELEPWIDGVITELFKIGFEVKALVSKHGYNLNKYAKEIKNISPQNIYFMVNNKIIYYIFDVPRLVNSFKTHFMTKDLSYNGNTVSWEHLKILYSLESRKKHKLAPKITLKNHIKPINLRNQEVLYSAQVFSKTVSTAIHTYVDAKMMDENARHTANFCSFFNDVYDVLNTNTYKNDNINKCALGSNESQVKLLKDALEIFGKMGFQQSRRHRARARDLPAIQHIQVTLASILSLAEDLRVLGYRHILTQRLNQVPMNTLIDLIRQKASKTCDLVRPTPIKFCRSFSELFLKSILTKSSLSNRPSGFEKFFDDALKLKIDKLSPTPLKKSVVTLSGDIDYQISLPDDYQAYYIACYLFYKCEQAHKCPIFKKYAKTMPILPETHIFNAQNVTFYGKFKLVDVAFLRYVEKLDNAILVNFQSSICSELGATLFDILKKVIYDPPCRCFPTKYLLKLLIRLRIYYLIKTYNRTYKRNKQSLFKFVTSLSPDS